MAQQPTPSQINNYGGAAATGAGVIYDALGQQRVIGANMTSGAAAGSVLQSDASGNLTLQPGLTLQATTGTAGFALQNGTPAICAWTVPTDGNMHRFLIFGGVVTASTETGGAIGVSYKYPDGSSTSDSLDGGSHSSGHNLYTARPGLVQAGATVTVAQTSALTGGTATTWAEIWGS